MRKRVQLRIHYDIKERERERERDREKVRMLIYKFMDFKIKKGREEIYTQDHHIYMQTENMCRNQWMKDRTKEEREFIFELKY